MNNDTLFMQSMKTTVSSALRTNDTEAIAHALLTGRGDTAQLSQERCLALLAIDADSIQKMLLASPRPVTTYGASTLLAKWDNNFYEQCSLQNFKATLLFAGGGNGIVLLPAEYAQSCAQIVEQKFREHVFGHATSAFILVSPYELVHGPNPLRAISNAQALNALGLASKAEQKQGFGACLSNLQLELQHKKHAHKEALFETPPRSPYCIECRAQSQTQGRLCSACHARREEGRKQKDVLNQAHSFEEFYEQSNYIAYIHLDGRGIGNLLFTMHTISDYRKLSDTLHKAFSLPDNKDTKHLCILSGGDDLLVVVPAAGSTNAFQFTLERIQHIEKTLIDYKCGVGAGIVIAKTEPADYCMERAFLLCKNAKTEPKTKDACSAVDFEILLDGSPISDSIHDMRASDRLQIGQSPPILNMKSLWMTQRPYPLPRFEKLLKQAQILGGAQSADRVPRSQLHLLQRELRKDIYTALISILYQAARHPVLKEALGIQSLTERVDKLSEWLFHKKDHSGEWATALPDLIELSALLGKGNEP